MCTLVLWWRAFPDAPLVVAANRDEDPRRPSAPASHWPDEPDGIFAGRDLTSGGTWLGVNGTGLVAGITNLWTGSPPDPTRRSRGLLVRDALRAPSAEHAIDELRALDAATANPFALLVADRASAWRIDGLDRIDVTRLEPGITVLANWLASTSLPRTERAAHLARNVPTARFADALPAIRTLLADHEGASEPGRAICAHGERYRTVSAAIVAVREGGFEWHELVGYPCEGEWRARA